MIDLKDCKPGAPVWYWPSPQGPKFPAIVDEDVRMLGETPVCRLRDLPPAYGEWRKSPRTTVPAAALFAIERREERAGDAQPDPPADLSARPPEEQP